MDCLDGVVTAHYFIDLGHGILSFISWAMEPWECDDLYARARVGDQERAHGEPCGRLPVINNTCSASAEAVLLQGSRFRRQQF